MHLIGTIAPNPAPAAVTGATGIVSPYFILNAERTCSPIAQAAADAFIRATGQSLCVGDRVEADVEDEIVQSLTRAPRLQ